MSVADGTFTENCDGEFSDMLNSLKSVFFNGASEKHFDFMKEWR